MNTSKVMSWLRSLGVERDAKRQAAEEAADAALESITALGRALALLPVAVAEYNGIKPSCLCDVQHTRMLDAARNVRNAREVVIGEFRRNGVEFEPSSRLAAGVNPYRLMTYVNTLAIDLISNGPLEDRTPFEDTEFLDAVDELIVLSGHICVAMGV